MIKEIFPDLFLVRTATTAPRTPFTYFLRRAPCNVLFATKDDVSRFKPALDELGGVGQIYLGDRHHAVPHTAALAKRFDTVLSASRIEAKALLAAGVKVERTLEYKRAMLAPDLEVIPTPGHTPGALSFLWSNQGRRFLLVGDTLVPVNGEWQYFVSRPWRAAMLQTAQLLAGLAFDVILSNSFASSPIPWVEVDAKYRRKMFSDLASGLSELA
jgi:glyoxylase-like metal-dependent hydrolase (beta-lactamase superfamily II)